MLCRSAAGFRRPSVAPTTTVVAPELSKRSEDTPSSTANVEVPKEACSAGSEGPKIPPTATPPASKPTGPTDLRASAEVDPNEVPVGLIEDVLLSAELCNESIDSLRHVYKHFKIMPL